jgi:hypothetical protein
VIRHVIGGQRDGRSVDARTGRSATPRPRDRHAVAGRPHRQRIDTGPHLRRRRGQHPSRLHPALGRLHRVVRSRGAALAPSDRADARRVHRDSVRARAGPGERRAGPRRHPDRTQYGGLRRSPRREGRPARAQGVPAEPRGERAAQPAPVPARHHRRPARHGRRLRPLNAHRRTRPPASGARPGAHGPPLRAGRARASPRVGCSAR